VVTDQGVVTDQFGARMLVRPLDNPTQQNGVLSADKERLSYNLQDIEAAEHAMETLRKYAHDVASVYPRVAG